MISFDLITGASFNKNFPHPYANPYMSWDDDKLIFCNQGFTYSVACPLDKMKNVANVFYGALAECANDSLTTVKVSFNDETSRKQSFGHSFSFMMRKDMLLNAATWVLCIESCTNMVKQCQEMAKVYEEKHREQR